VKIITHPGIWSRGELSTDRLGLELAGLGYHVENVEHENFARLIDARGKATEFAAAVLPIIDPGDVFIGHSHGALVGYECMRLGARFSKAFLVGAAIDSWITFPHHGADRIIVAYNPHDIALVAGSLLPLHPFGTLGKSGYTGPPDDRVHHYRFESRAGKWNHTSPYFDEPGLSRLTSIVDEQLREIEAAAA
jgi:hypothetical protein